MKKFLKIAACVLFGVIAQERMLAAEPSEQGGVEESNDSVKPPAVTTALLVNPAIITSTISCCFRPRPRFDWTFPALGGDYGIQGGNMSTDLVWGSREYFVAIPFYNFVTGLAGIVVLVGFGAYGFARKRHG